MIMFVFFCTSCANIDYSMEINRDDSAYIEYLINLDDKNLDIIFCAHLDVVPANNYIPRCLR